MKKIFFALAGIVMVASATIIYSCNKENHEIANEENIITEAVQTKANPDGAIEQPVTPTFLFRSPYSPLFQGGECRSAEGHFCGCSIDATLSGDEACWLMVHEKDPYRDLRFYITQELLFKNHANEVVDSAKNGALTFNADCEILDAKLAKLIGTDLIPAGRYRTQVTTYKGKPSVCVYFGKVLL